MTSGVTVTRGSLYLPKEVYDRYFAGVEAVVLQRRSEDLMVLPVRHAPAGGYLLKRRNARGDRVVSAPEFFRSQGVDDDREIDSTIQWDAAASALLAGGLFRH
ncbi:hypothetical protein [Rhodospirillaceae bacterium SYSU D60014]|uniref:hypothetical protein n=1 Tax=Virgifigura deserti TaxID=2268457 RepID=UPI000E6616E3